MFLFLSGSAFAQKRNITEKDLFSFVWVGDTQISPDGNRAVFVQTTVNAKHDGYATALYLLDLTQPGAKPRQLTNGPHDAQPRWSPDGKQIAFVRALEKEGKPQPGQVFLLPMAGGEPMQLNYTDQGCKLTAVVSGRQILGRAQRGPDHSRKTRRGCRQAGR